MEILEVGVVVYWVRGGGGGRMRVPVLFGSDCYSARRSS